MTSLAKYVLVTPARNEASFIELTIKSVVAQSVLPVKWVIVSDGSTDGTDEIVNRYAAEHDWIEMLRMPDHTDRHFAAKVAAFNAGLARMAHLDYDVIGALDADISCDPDYFAFLLRKLAENPRLGLVGTPFSEDGKTYDYRFASVEYVSGCCQVFRRECFEEIGGYRPLKGGGIDMVANLSAKMKGWQVRTFVEKTCQHHRKQGEALNHGLAVFFQAGRKDYRLGAHPVWQLCRAVFRLGKRPYVVGGLCLFAGYFGPMLMNEPKVIPEDVMAFRRQDQSARLRAILLRRLGLPAGKRAPIPDNT